MINLNERIHSLALVPIILLLLTSHVCGDESFKTTIKVNSKYVLSIAFSPDGKTLASSSMPSYRYGGYDGRITLWDTESGKQIETFVTKEVGSHAVSFSHDGKYLAAISTISTNSSKTLNDRLIKIWDIEHGKIYKTINVKKLSEFEFLRGVVLFSPVENIVAYNEGHMIKLWDIENGMQVSEFNTSIRIESLAFSPDGKRIAAADSDKIQVWDIEIGEVITTIEDNGDYTISLAFSPDGKSIASSGGGDSNGYVKLWDSVNGNLVAKYSGNSKVNISIAFSHDGKIIASGGLDSQIQIWRVEDSRLITTLDTKSGYANSIAFSPDGDILASGNSPDKSMDESGNYIGTIMLWDKEAFDEQEISEVYQMTPKDDFIALHQFYNTHKHVNIDIVKKAVNEISILVEKKNTISDYKWFIYNYPYHKFAKDAAEMAYTHIQKEKNIFANTWFINKFLRYPISKTVLQDTYNLAYEMAAEENTLESYNDFIIAYPFSKQVNDALDKSYKIREEIYSGWFSSDEKNSRALRVKMKQLETKMQDSNDILMVGYVLVLNQMGQLLQDKFPAEEATLRYLESDSFSEFHEAYKITFAIIQKVSDNLIDQETSADTKVLETQISAINSYFPEDAQSSAMAEKYSGQRKLWEQYIEKNGI